MHCQHFYHSKQKRKNNFEELHDVQSYSFNEYIYCVLQRKKLFKC